jgi:hypothetical protein
MALQHDTSVGAPTWRVVAALVWVGVLLAALVVVNGREVDSVAAPAAPREFVVEAAAEPSLGDAAANASSSTSDAGLRVGVDRVEGDLDAALRAWGVFAATGDLAAVEGAFAVDGPQYDQLQSEVADRLANAPGLPAFDFLMRDAAIVDSSKSAMVLRGDVVLQRAGVAAETFRWDVEMRWDGELGRWVLWTVAEAGG